MVFLFRGAVLTRVRRRIDHLTTSRLPLLAKGQVACRFKELSIDSPQPLGACRSLQSESVRGPTRVGPPLDLTGPRPWACMS